MVSKYLSGVSLADESPSDRRLSWRLSPDASLAYARRFDERARSGTWRLRTFLLIGAAAMFGWQLRHAPPATALTFTAGILIPAFAITELALFAALRRPARRLVEAAPRGLDVAVLLPTGARIGPVELVAGDRTGFPRPDVLVDETVFPPLLRVTGIYRSYRTMSSYHLEVPIAPEALAGVKAWLGETEAKHLVAILGRPA